MEKKSVFLTVESIASFTTHTVFELDAQATSVIKVVDLSRKNLFPFHPQPEELALSTEFKGSSACQLRSDA